MYPRLNKKGTKNPHLIEKCNELIADLTILWTYRKNKDVEYQEDQGKNLANEVQDWEENIGSSDYVFQLCQKIENLQMPFESSLEPILGIKISRIFEIFKQILQIQRDGSQKFLSKKVVDNAIPYCDQIPATEEEWNALKKIVGLTIEQQESITSLEYVRNRPLYFLSKNRCLLANIFQALRAVFEYIENEIKVRGKKLFDRYQENKKKHIEQTVPCFLSRLFPESTIHYSVLYPDPDKPLGNETELDALIIWEPFLIIIEIKGSQFRQTSRGGKISHLITDLKENIKKAYDQANRFSRYINNTQESIIVLKEKYTKKECRINKDKIKKILLINVTLHGFLGLATQLANLKKLNLFKSSDYIWSLSLSDLDIITRTFTSAHKFIHYAYMRMELQNSEKWIKAEELDLLGYYLDDKLETVRKKWEHASTGGIAFEGNQERFDEIYLRPGEKEEKIPCSFPLEIGNIIDQLESSEQIEARWITFRLLSLSSETLNTLGLALLEAKKQCKDIKFFRLVEKDVLIFVFIIRGVFVPIEEIKYNLKIEKYIHKTSQAIGLFIKIVDNVYKLENAFYEEEKYEYKEQMEHIKKQYQEGLKNTFIQF